MKSPFAIEDRGDILLAQVEAFRKRIPLLYGVLMINTASLAVTQYGVAPIVLSTYVPLFMCAVMLVRLFQWRNTQVVTLNAAEARHIVVSTSVIGSALGAVMLAWALALLLCDRTLAGGDAGADRGHVIVYVALTVMSSIFLLMHVRAAALAVTLIVIPPFCTYLMLTGDLHGQVTAVNVALVAAAMMYVLLIFSRDFQQLVRSRTELRSINEMYSKLAYTDAVTGLPNRRRFLADLQSHRSDAFAIIVVDLDGFKQINDLHGHVAGDRLLVEVGRRLAATAPAGACVARMGGDEFAILLPESSQQPASVRQQALKLAEDLIDAIRAPVVLGDLLANIGASAGISIADRLSATEAPLDHYKRADYALFHAKNGGRGRAEVFTPAHEQSIRRDGEIEQALRTADLDREISVFFQPIVEATDGRVIAHEALARWTSPQLGHVQPDAFVAIAERSTLIHDLTRTVLRKALEKAQHWPDHIRVKVNLSVCDLASPQQILQLVALLRRAPVKPSRLCVEVTESAFQSDLTAVEAGLMSLRALGVTVAIDDFGTGYSNLRYIHRLLPDTIKIDRCFVERLAQDAHARSIVKTIIELCHNVGARSLAEGAETAVQVAILRALGCDEIQGYFFGKPIDTDESETEAGVAERTELQTS